jgi:hypothetical protein
MRLREYLKPEYKNALEVQEIEAMFQNCGEHRFILRVSVDVGDAVTRFLKRAIDPMYYFYRKTGGGTRLTSSTRGTCLRKDATHFRYYIYAKRPNVVYTNIKYCSMCGRTL